MDSEETQTVKKPATTKSNNQLIPIAIVVAGALVAFAIIFSNNQQSAAPTVAAPADNEQPEAPTFDPEDVEIEMTGYPTMGSDEAPVQLVEFSDYACPFCKRFVDETKPQIIAEYVDEGLVQIVRKDLIAVGGNKAAEAAHCAGDQGAYWEYHDLLIANQAADRGNWSDPSVHAEYATELGLDADALVSCFNDGTHTERVASATNEAATYGGTGTPFFLINGVPVSGAQPYAVFKRVIDLALDESGQ